MSNNLSVLTHLSPGNLFISSTLTPCLYLTSTHSATHHWPTFSPGSPTLELSNRSGPMIYCPSVTQTTISTTRYHVYDLQPLHDHQFCSDPSVSCYRTSPLHPHLSLIILHLHSITSHWSSTVSIHWNTKCRSSSEEWY